MVIAYSRHSAPTMARPQLAVAMAATTTNHVADAAGVSVGSLYQYFPNKDALLVALGERHVALASEQLAMVAVVQRQLAVLAEPLIDDAERRLAQGLLLRNETAPLRPAELQRLDALRVEITVTEGRYHQVRRMFAALGNRVVSLHRQRIGGLTLDERLRPGQWRALTPAERAAVLPCGKLHQADRVGPLPKVQVISE